MKATLYSDIIGQSNSPKRNQEMLNKLQTSEAKLCFMISLKNESSLPDKGKKDREKQLEVWTNKYEIQSFRQNLIKNIKSNS